MKINPDSNKPVKLFDVLLEIKVLIIGKLASKVSLWLLLFPCNEMPFLSNLVVCLYMVLYQSIQIIVLGSDASNDRQQISGIIGLL